MNIQRKKGRILGVMLLIGTSCITMGSSYLLDNIPIINRSQRGANEERRFYIPKQDKDNTSSYIPSNLTDREKKLQIAEKYIIKAFPIEFKIDKVISKSGKSRLKRPLSYKKNKKKIVLHHTAISNQGVDSFAKEIQAVQEIYKFHTFSRERGDIGYNYLIGPSGRIYEGRYGGAKVVGAHATRNNTDSIGISLLGNFDIEKPSQEQIDALVKLIVALGQAFNINPMEDTIYHEFDEKIDPPYIHNFSLDSIVGHMDIGSTSCPGTNLYNKIPHIKWEAAKQLGYVGSSISPAPNKQSNRQPKIKRKTSH